MLDRLAQPRFPGTSGWRATHAYLRDVFGELGWQVRPMPFQASLLPGKYAFPAAGLALFASSSGAILALADGRNDLAVLLLAAGAALVGIIGRGAAGATDRWKRGRIELANLYVAMPYATPRWLFVAHLDSKSQFVPLSLRATSAAAALVVWGVLLFVTLLGSPISQDAMLLATLGVVASLAGIPLVLSGSGNASPGALDNASGVATLIGLAHAQRGADDVAFLITDGEELGLAGSRAFVRRSTSALAVINVDGVDDDGGFYLLDRFGLRRERPPSDPVRALLACAPASDTWVHRRRVPFGLVLDHMSFAKAGIPALTLMRGTVRSMVRVHRPIDDVAHLRGDGVGSAVRLLSAALEELRR